MLAGQSDARPLPVDAAGDCRSPHTGRATTRLCDGPRTAAQGPQPNAGRIVSAQWDERAASADRVEDRIASNYTAFDNGAPTQRSRTPAQHGRRCCTGWRRDDRARKASGGIAAVAHRSVSTSTMRPLPGTCTRPAAATAYEARCRAARTRGNGCWRLNRGGWSTRGSRTCGAPIRPKRPACCRRPRAR